MSLIADARTETLGPAFIDVPWALEDHHRIWRRTVRTFCEERVRPAVAIRDLNSTFDVDLVAKVGEIGVLGMLIPEEYGGSGADLRSLCIAVEELGRIDSSLAVTAHVQAIVASLFHHAANDEQRAEWLPKMARGDSLVAIGLTEPSGGSDAANVRTTAVRRGDHWVINGAKQFITNSGTPRSDHAIVFAATGEQASGRPEVTAFFVPLGQDGVTVGSAYSKMGWRASDTHPLFFEDVRVGDDAVLGRVGEGNKHSLGFLVWARIPFAALAVGVAQGCLEETLRFIGSRTSFGQPLGKHEAVAFGTAEMAALTAMARTIVYDAAWKRDKGLAIEQEAAICKLTAADIANRVAYRATGLHGGYGFVEESAVARHYRDARVLTIGEGTSEVQKMLIARQLGLPV